MTTVVFAGAEPRHPLGQKLTQIFGQHPWQSIQADNVSPHHPVHWRTHHYPVWPRVLWQRWQDPNTIIGVRFGNQTTYGLLDIDAGSPYQTPEAIAQIRAALETIGITRTLLLRSSHSNGLHLYLPLPEPVATFGLAVCLQQCLQAHHFPLAPGRLEIFPNVKTYGVERFIQYNGHRLPLQPRTGSCLLDDALLPVGNHLEQFLRHWDSAATGQDLEFLHSAIAHAREARKQVSRRRRWASPLQEWQADMEQEMAEGWTGPGQTNYLLKVIGCHGHVILKLSGQNLQQHIAETARRLPGYQQHCQHQSHLPQRARAWARSIEKLYWPAGTHPQVPAQPVPSWNDQRAHDARTRIANAVAHLKADGVIPGAISHWAQQIIAAAHCSLQTLYKHLALWHPHHTNVNAEDGPECVNNGTDSFSAASTLAAQPSDEPPTPWGHHGLHTKAVSMKCEGGDETILVPKKSLDRGVRGDWLHFPQPLATTTESPIPFSEIHPLIQAQVQALKWSMQDARRFLSTHFQGRSHLWELQTHELTTCLYHLQVEVLSRGSR
jgi:hypothetical protein